MTTTNITNFSRLVPMNSCGIESLDRTVTIKPSVFAPYQLTVIGTQQSIEKWYEQWSETHNNGHIVGVYPKYNMIVVGCDFCDYPDYERYCS